ncbi:hypothetical protein HMPREF0724_12702 [Prescottella equi ATCC 33707]|uniref:Uncharacterized protein n=1 Tax=Prescottella equi ATCC 33707 TaxID=525370 RepID=E9T2C5_RHOHA|nr:hypothetical protein HMPREF0724_12702 [Prescottella equi ATCC 33707]
MRRSVETVRQAVAARRGRCDRASNGCRSGRGARDCGGRRRRCLSSQEPTECFGRWR